MLIHELNEIKILVDMLWEVFNSATLTGPIIKVTSIFADLACTRRLLLDKNVFKSLVCSREVVSLNSEYVPSFGNNQSRVRCSTKEILNCLRREKITNKALRVVYSP